MRVFRGARERGPPLVRATVNPAAHATKVARHFLGISAEYRGLLRALGHPQAGVNPVLAQLLANLATEGQGAPVLRIGGGTADSAWWNPAGLPQPNGIEIDLNDYTRQAIFDFQRATGAPLIIDLNMAAGKVAYARDWAGPRSIASPPGDRGTGGRQRARRLRDRPPFRQPPADPAEGLLGGRLHARAATVHEVASAAARPPAARGPARPAVGAGTGAPPGSCARRRGASGC